MFGIFKRINDLEDRVKTLEEKNEALSGENIRLNKALIKTQDILTLVSQGASALAIDVAGIINIINPQVEEKVKQAKISAWNPTDDEVIN
jgi:hypothetical protein